ncbi:membrane-bound transcription factor site-2 protease [Prorops nasuta]|uniref:membrane-bound transcription factor site-2 protease n=1 Tax=Prorops nasuta TaxID=863751 RepID=UPI0034CD32C1
MDALSVLIVIGLIHCSLFFFDVMFKTCSHLPYLYFLKNTGLEIQILRVKWFTTAFNRRIIKWGMDRSRFWTAWFNAGVIINIILLPIAVVLILKMTFNFWSSGSNVDTSQSEVGLDILLPGVNMPFNEIGYYTITLGICSIVHEMGHALAAAKEDVQLFGLGVFIVFFIPIAFVRISSEQLAALPLKNQLRVTCAGVWHNLIFATLAATILMLSTWFWTPLYILGHGVFVKTILPNSPVLGPSGLLQTDVIYKLNNCAVKHSDDWYYCILQATQQPAQGYCVKQSFVQEFDESVPSRQNTNGVVNCCTADSELNGNVCFEYIEGPQSAPLHLPPHSCLPVRTMVNQSKSFCQSSHECSSIGAHCMKPSLDNMTKILQIKRTSGKDVLFFGYPAHIYKTVDVSDWVPKYSFLHPEMPERLTLLCEYITYFSVGAAIINVVPCFFLDGQYILSILVTYFLGNKPQNKHIRQVTTLTITCIGTIILAINLISWTVNKLL